MTPGTASADPAKLEAAARAVPGDLAAALANAHLVLSDMIDRFHRGTQSPERIRVDPDLAGALQRVVRWGDDLDLHLVRVAAAFRAAGDGRPPGFIGPLASGGVRYMDDDALVNEMARWDVCRPVEFRQRDDGTYEVLGPDGHWYVTRDAPPMGAVPLDRQQAVVDLGYDHRFVQSAAFVVGATGGSTQPLARPAPPAAYEYIHLDENGYPVVGPEVTGHSGAPGSLPLSTDGSDPRNPRDAAFGGVGLVMAGLVEAGKYADAKYTNVFRTQTTFYVDPQTGERVAVVDAARITYNNSSGDAIVTSGRLSTDDRGDPVLVPRPPEYDPDAPHCPSPDPDQPSIGPATRIHIPAEEDR